MTRQLASAALACLLSAQALAAKTEVKVQSSHKKVQVEGEGKTSFHLVEKGKRLTATVKGPADVTVLLHGAANGPSANAAVGLFLDKKKIHFVDLKGTAKGKITGGYSAGPLKSETIKIPAGSHEIGVEAFVGTAAVAFRAHGGAGGEAAVAAGSKRGKHHKGAAAEPAPVAEAVPVPPEPTPAPAPEPVAAAPEPTPAPTVAAVQTPPPVEAPPPTAAPPANPALTSSTVVATPVTAGSTTPVPAAATSTVEVEKPSGHSTATYWLAGGAVLLAGGAATAWGLSTGLNASYNATPEASSGTAANPARSTILQRANTELTIAEILAGAAALALAASAIVAW